MTALGRVGGWRTEQKKRKKLMDTDNSGLIEGELVGGSGRGYGGDKW